MKRVVSINLGNYGSTGRIMIGISNLAEERGYETYIAYPDSKFVQPAMKNDIIICSSFWNRVNQKLAYITGLNGCFAPLTTRRFLKKLSEIKPDIIHFHNLHNSYLNLPMLFDYVRKNHFKVIWTLHDCWSFTGHCPHFTLAGCDKWKTGCGDCPQLSVYPPARIDQTRRMWKKKKQWFSGVEDLTVVTPSEWLAGFVKQSFLSQYPIRVVPNGIDLSRFSPSGPRFRREWDLNGKKRYFVLGVAFDWGVRKGLDVFIQLSERLPEEFQIVLVGTNESIDSSLPNNILSIHRTSDQEELAQIYSSADVFLNPTREDNFPTVNLEALACGTPVITFDVGGSAESLDASCGVAVPAGDLDVLERETIRVCLEKPFSREACVARAKEFEMIHKFNEYVDYYG